MSLNAALKILLEEYPKERSHDFKGNALADFIRNEIPVQVAESMELEARYQVEGSPGKGNWAAVPWVAVLDKFITDTVQDGYYVVYLVKEDFSGLYLSLNQGVTTVKKQYGSAAKDALEIRAKDFLARLGDVQGNYRKGRIDLACSQTSQLAKLYEFGSIVSLYYDAKSLPDDRQLKNDLVGMLHLYFSLFFKESSLFNEAEREDDEADLEFENLQKIRIHKRIERNKKLSGKVKKLKGYTCEACGFNFEKCYGDIGKGFIEAHHLTPLSSLKGERVALDPVNDFAVLCSNCHKMIHRSEFVSEIQEFRANYVVQKS
ncbi:MrcB family domain-containing protein [Pseudofrancisella aestuarii]|uniref:MrcB family domain-containing protein n=1 Tax=Pseudofrancisella aestuarii TaxID=2670347 RepID=A0ABV9TB43_9GAMM|nr:DUF3578 domain-containing protein [Pseudofrancisella aestuarii]